MTPLPLSKDEYSSFHQLFDWMVSLHILSSNALYYSQILLQDYSIYRILDLYEAVVKKKYINWKDIKIKNKIEEDKLTKGLLEFSKFINEDSISNIIVVIVIHKFKNI